MKDSPEASLGVLAAIAVAAWALLFRSSSSSSAPASSAPAPGGPPIPIPPAGAADPWPVVPVLNTGAGDARAWDVARYNALQTALINHSTPEAVRVKLTRAMLAHFLSETGRTSEHNFNVANMVPTRWARSMRDNPALNWRGEIFLLPGSTNAWFRAYPDPEGLQRAVDDYVGVIAGTRYGDVLGQLAAGTIDEPTWYSNVRRAGWSVEPPTTADLAVYNTLLARLRTEFPG